MMNTFLQIVEPPYPYILNINVQTCQALVRNVIFKFMARLEKSTNVIIRWLVCPSVSDVIYRSKIWTH